eukprot:m.460343 g.460343  ORF g.460343 m.460343 type:complete len:685 (+) comp21592_c0_seq1:197-2251(+)
MGCFSCSAEAQDSQFVSPEGRKRRCTDVLFLLIFGFFIAGLVAVGSWALDNGEPTRLLYGADSWGNICGEKNKQRINSSNSGLDMSNRKHQYHTGVSNEAEDAQAMIVCASACPTKDLNCATQLEECQALGVCLSTQPDGTGGPYTVPTDTANPDQGIEVNGVFTGCPEVVIVTTTNSILRRCIPRYDNGASDALRSYIDDLNAETYIGQIYESFAAASDVIFYCLLIAFVLSYLAIVLMKYFVRPMVWICVVLMIGSMTYITYYLWDRYDYMKKDIELQENNGIPVSTNEERERDFYFYSAIIFGVVALLMLLLTIALRRDIAKAIDLYKEASEAIKAMPSMFLAPFFTYIFLFAAIAMFIYTGVFLITTEDYVFINVSASTGYGHIKYVEKDEYVNNFWYFLFGVFWISQFVLACEELSLAGCVTEWYVRMHETKFGAYFRSCYRTTRYHLGTVAFGSLIIAIVQFLRVMLEWVDKKIQAAAESQGAVSKQIARFAMCCCRCCLWCLEKCLKFINKNAYIETALYGLDFCNAACKAFGTILRNLMAFGAIAFVSFIVIFTIKLVVAGAVAIVGFQWLDTYNNDDEQGNEIPLIGIVVLVLFIVAWFIAGAFASIYEMAADTLLLVFAEDCSQPNGPHHASKRLLKYVSKASAEHNLDKEKIGLKHRGPGPSRNTENHGTFAN